MNMTDPTNDLVVLTADKNAQFALKGVLRRSRSLGMREIGPPDYLVHPQKDPGVLNQPELLLRTFVRTHAHALLVMDREGSGREHMTRVEMEHLIEARLTQCGWGNRVAAIVVDPELDVWVWSDSPHVDVELQWAGRNPPLREWLASEGYIENDQIKPARPKEALECALREVRKPRSSAIYLAIAEKVGLERCTDHAFIKLRSTLRRWFPA